MGDSPDDEVDCECTGLSVLASGGDAGGAEAGCY